MSKPDHEYHEVRRENTLIFLVFFIAMKTYCQLMLLFGVVFICLQKWNYHKYFRCKMCIAFYNKVKVKLKMHLTKLSAYTREKG